MQESNDRKITELAGHVANSCRCDGKTRNLWAKLRPEDALECEAGAARGLAVGVLGRMNDMNIVTARKLLVENKPEVVGRWNLKWLTYPDLETYFTDPACRDEDGNQLPKLFWERLLLASTLGSNETFHEGKPLWHLAATTTPIEFVRKVLPPVGAHKEWAWQFFEGARSLSNPAPYGDEGRLANAFATVGKSIATPPTMYEEWVVEAWGRAAVWVPPERTAPAEVIRVDFKTQKTTNA